jgi:phospholipase C
VLLIFHPGEINMAKFNLRLSALYTGIALMAMTTAACAQRAGFWDEAETLSKIGHIVVIYEENRSFDSYFGNFPGANGRANATTAQMTQVDASGNPYPQLPPIINTSISGSPVDTRFPTNLPNAPFAIQPYVSQTDKTGDLVHRFLVEQRQINGGKMNRFANASDSGGLVMGYWDNSNTNEWKYATQYVMCDNFFHSAFGGSFLNHQYLIASQAPRFLNPPSNLLSTFDANGNYVGINDGAVTNDGYAVNTIRSVQFHAPSDTNPAVLLPVQDYTTIGDELSAKGITWKWYSAGVNNAIAGKPAALFQFHHHPFLYFKKYAPGTAEQIAHIQDLPDFLNDIQKGTLPQVVFYKPIGENNLHPGYANITDGDTHLKTIIDALQASPNYADMMIIITFDEHGGQWDHVAPPTRDRWGPGIRVPAIVISPFAKRGYVDHTQYDTGSILKTIEERFNLAPLSSSDANVVSLRNTLQ